MKKKIKLELDELEAHMLAIALSNEAWKHKLKADGYHDAKLHALSETAFATAIFLIRIKEKIQKAFR